MSPIPSKPVIASLFGATCLMERVYGFYRSTMSKFSRSKSDSTLCLFYINGWLHLKVVSHLTMQL